MAPVSSTCYINWSLFILAISPELTIMRIQIYFAVFVMISSFGKSNLNKMCFLFQIIELMAKKLCAATNCNKCAKFIHFSFSKKAPEIENMEDKCKLVRFVRVYYILNPSSFINFAVPKKQFSKLFYNKI